MERGKAMARESALPHADADGQPPRNMDSGKDKRADKPCNFLAAGHCRLGSNCLGNHKMKPGKGVELCAAAPS
eukprot:13950449-Heterocapsa_arctica.AAC.1